MKKLLAVFVCLGLFVGCTDAGKTKTKTEVKTPAKTAAATDVKTPADGKTP
jgi:hypothetical protein